MKNWNLWAVALFIACISVIGLKASSYAVRAATGTAETAPQDVQSLDRRLSMLEQRLYFIESRINRLEQQSVVTARPTPSTDQGKLQNELLRAEVETLKGQISEIECGMAKLDERTLPATLRESRGRDSNLNRDPCRLDPQAPLRLSGRP